METLMKMKWKIGSVEIENPFILAPMAGSSIPYSLQGAGGRSVVHRDGQCKGDFFS